MNAFLGLMEEGTKPTPALPAPPRDEEVLSWTVDDVAAWGKEAKLSAATRRALVENEMTGEDLLEMTRADLRAELRIKALRDRNALRAAIVALDPYAKIAEEDAGRKKKRLSRAPAPARAEVEPEKAADGGGEETNEAGGAEDGPERDMDESMWEAALLVGEPDLGYGDAATIVSLLVMSVVLQLLFLMAAVQLARGKVVTEETVDDLRRFRLTVAHDVTRVRRADVRARRVFARTT